MGNPFDDIDDALREAITALDETFDIGIDFDRFNQNNLTLHIKDVVVKELEEIEMELNNDKFLDDVSEMYNVYYPTKMDDGEVVLELETATDNGTLMSLYLEEDSNMSWLNQLKDYVRKFDVDKEVDSLRQSKGYKNRNSISESLEDIETYIEDVDNWIYNHEENLDYVNDNKEKKKASANELEM